MNIKKIIREEMGDFEWMESVNNLSYGYLSGKSIEFDPPIGSNGSKEEEYLHHVISTLEDVGFSAPNSLRNILDDPDGEVTGLFFSQRGNMVWTNSIPMEDYQDHIDEYADDVGLKTPIVVLNGRNLIPSKSINESEFEWTDNTEQPTIEVGDMFRVPGLNPDGSNHSLVIVKGIYNPENGGHPLIMYSVETGMGELVDWNRRDMEDKFLERIVKDNWVPSYRNKGYKRVVESKDVKKIIREEMDSFDWISSDEKELNIKPGMVFTHIDKETGKPKDDVRVTVTSVGRNVVVCDFTIGGKRMLDDYRIQKDSIHHYLKSGHWLLISDIVTESDNFEWADDVTEIPYNPTVGMMFTLNDNGYVYKVKELGTTTFMGPGFLVIVIRVDDCEYLYDSNMGIGDYQHAVLENKVTIVEGC